jgi:hypothetical protein
MSLLSSLLSVFPLFSGKMLAPKAAQPESLRPEPSDPRITQEVFADSNRPAAFVHDEALDASGPAPRKSAAPKVPEEPAGIAAFFAFDHKAEGYKDGMSFSQATYRSMVVDRMVQQLTELYRVWYIDLDNYADGLLQEVDGLDSVMDSSVIQLLSRDVQKARRCQQEIREERTKMNESSGRIRAAVGDYHIGFQQGLLDKYGYSHPDGDGPTPQG